MRSISRGVAVLAVLVCAPAAFAQQTRVDRAFTATGASCDQVTWSGQALRQYPNIASACRDVMERDGNYYVLFEGEVRRVADRGRQVTVDFEGGDELTLTPPENLSIFIDGRRTSPRQLRPGDQLNFYVPQQQLVATFFAGEPATAQPQEVPIEEPADRYAAADSDFQGNMPDTAGELPLAALAGLLLVGLGAALTTYRLTRS